MLSPILLPEAEDPYLDERVLDPSQAYTLTGVGEAGGTPAKAAW